MARKQSKDKQPIEAKIVETDRSTNNEATPVLLADVVNMLDEAGLNYDPPHVYVDAEGLPMFLVELRILGAFGEYRVEISSELEGHSLMVRTYCPFRVPTKRFPEILEYMNRANWGRVHCNLEMNMADGEIASRMSVDFRDSQPFKGVIRSLFAHSFFSMDYFYPAIEAIMIGEVGPLEAEMRLFEKPPLSQ